MHTLLLARQLDMASLSTSHICKIQLARAVQSCAGVLVKQRAAETVL